MKPVISVAELPELPFELSVDCRANCLSITERLISGLFFKAVVEGETLAAGILLSNTLLNR
jgi:hypothetical protein